MYTPGRAWAGLLLLLDWLSLPADAAERASVCEAGSPLHRPLLADVGYGLALCRGHWRYAVARYHRTHEFRGQIEVPVYGTVTIGRRC
ncbi:MAG: DUF2219 family protein [Steroidobacteraceae bacterium]|nr:DUF2219 family protein [Nevskiaceae bacterium]MCP5466132.1 DUF2219 family protein [Nevskiaceae bacterium]MCP5471534.1 DUF2219 family protein [Nevskiaceae bacterium]